MKYWLMKSEPRSYSIEDLQKDKETMWDGVRNYQARNFMRDDMHVGDKVLFYHSNANPPAVVGLARVVRESYADPTAFDPKDEHFDPKSKKDKPQWFLVDIAYVRTFKTPLSLQEIKEDPVLKDMRVAQKGARLSVQPVEKIHYDRIVRMSA